MGVMEWKDVLLPVSTAGGAIITMWLQPLNVVLVVGLFLFGTFMRRANQRSDFSLIDALRGDDGKCSMGRILTLVAVIFATWALMNCAAAWQTQPHEFVEIFAIYTLVLIAPKILSEWIAAKYGSRDVEKQ